MDNKKVIVGMSGGVDSSVTAMLLKEQGYDVTGVIMQVWSGDDDPQIQVKKNSCYGPDEKEDIEEAQKIAKKIGIPLHVIDLRKEYQENVLDYFKSEYQEGRTPNPCVKCNWKVKFGALLEGASGLGIDYDYFATGHYVRVGHDENLGRYLLKKAKDKTKDQSYFLCFLSQEQLGKCIFPLGEYTKAEIKEKAKALGLGLENKTESQNFAACGQDVLLEGTSVPGNILDLDGNVLGKHRGISYYTIGQRKGLGVSSKEPVYVVRINKEESTVIVGPKEALLGTTLIAENLNWIAFDNLIKPIAAQVRIRYQHQESQANVTPLNNNQVQVKFDNPQEAITPGQVAVFYQGDLVLGAGFIR